MRGRGWVRLTTAMPMSADRRQLDPHNVRAVWSPQWLRARHGRPQMSTQLPPGLSIAWRNRASALLICFSTALTDTPMWRAIWV